MASLGADRGLAMDTVVIVVMMRAVNFMMKVGRSCLFDEVLVDVLRTWRLRFGCRDCSRVW
jgi:hypothetical protein